MGLDADRAQRLFKLFHRLHDTRFEDSGAGLSRLLCAGWRGAALVMTGVGLGLPVDQRSAAAEGRVRELARLILPA